MKKNLLLLSLLSLLGLVTSCYDDSELRGRIENLENSTIPSITDQITSIRSSISDLQNVDNAVKASIADLQAADDALNNDIAGLQNADTNLAASIENLQTYVNDAFNNQTDWVNATFATLEQYATLTTSVASLQTALEALQTNLQESLQAMDEKNSALFAGVGIRIDSLAAALTQSEAGLKTWIGEQFANYYDIAAVDARLAMLNDSIVKGDEALATEIASVRSALGDARTELTTAYQSAIKKAIEDNNGIITTQIATEITAVNSHIDEQVARLDGRVDAVEARVTVLEGKVDELLKKLDITFDVDGSVAYSPGTTVEVNYTLKNADENTIVECIADAGWKATVEKTSSSTGKITVVTPSAGGEGKVLVFANKDDRTAMRVLRFEQGTLTVLTDVTAVEAEGDEITVDAQTNVDFRVIIPAEAQSWIELKNVATRTTMRTDVITLSIKLNATSESRSAVITLVDTQDKELSSFTIFQRADVQASNEIWYTSIDGYVVDPKNPRGFGGVNIVSNTYVKGKGVIVFDGDPKTVGNGAFNENGWSHTLQSVSLPDGITSIGEYAFECCSSLTSVTIPVSVTSIGDRAFAICSSLSSVTIPASVTSIGRDAFESCSSLSSVTIPASVTSIGEYAFECCSSLTSVTIPASVTSIGESTFNGCISLTSVTIPESVTSIGERAFYECSSLTAVTIPASVTSIGNNAFYECSSLTSVTIPASVTSIPGGCFSGCSSLTSVTIPASVTSIGEYAFSDCTGLTLVICLSTTVPYVYENSFPNDVANYCSLYVPAGSVSFYSEAEGWKEFKEIKEIDN